MARLLFIAPLLVACMVPVYFLFLKSPPPLPQFDLDEWWGPTQLKQSQDKSIKPFKVNFSDEMIQDLRNRLKMRRSFTPPLEGISFEYGFNTKVIDSWAKYWAEKYDFKEREKFLNKYPQFKTNIQGLDIHFIRVKPQVPAGVEVVPLLLLHGWPGSVREFYEAIPILTSVGKDRNFAFEVIIPSLPGYGWSDATSRPGLSAPKMAVIFRNLMQRLGFKQYYVQGGDWGSVIGTAMATLFSKEVLGYHANMLFSMSPASTIFEIIGSVYPSLLVEPELQDRLYPLSQTYSYLIEETGYMHIQASKPDTVGAALTDSPTGLMVYILEKFSTWTRPEHRNKPDGGLEFRFTKDQLIDNLMMYWSSNSITTSMRLYAETFSKETFSLNLDEIPTSVPTWGVQAKYELAYQPPCILKRKFKNLVNITVIQDGGHFLAFELPKLFAEDVIKAVGEFRKIKKNTKTDL